MKLVYISGPYRAYNKDGSYSVNGIHDNIERARRVAGKYWGKGYAVICPHMNTAYMDTEPERAAVFLDGDLEMVRLCDAIVMMDGWEKSEGAKRELEEAEANALEVIYDHEPAEVVEIKVDGNTTWKKE